MNKGGKDVAEKMRTKRVVCMRISVITLVLISIISLLTAEKTNAAGVVDPYGIIKKPIPDKTVVLTFDDGCLSHFDFVAPLLKKHGFGATFLHYRRYGV